MNNTTTQIADEDYLDLHVFSAAVHKAIDELPTSNRLNSEQMEVLYGIAYTHVEQNQWGQALPLFSFLHWQMPTRRHYLAGVAKCQRELGLYEEAKYHYAVMLALFPDQLEPSVQLAECQIALGETAEALETLQLLSEVAEDGSPLKARAQSFWARLNASIAQK